MPTINQSRLYTALAASLLFTLSLAIEETAFDNVNPRLIPRAYPKNLKHTSDKVHGVVMGLTVILIFPLGALSWKLLDRVCNPRTLLWIHIGCQILGLSLLITGFGIGVWVAILHDEVYNDPQGHVILGTIITALFLLQPFIGAWHHHLHKASKANNILRQGHVWFGRILIILAIVNGGTGLLLGDNSPGGEKAYEALAVITGVVYIGSLALWYFNRSKNSGEKGSGSEAESGSAEGDARKEAGERVGDV